MFQMRLRESAFVKKFIALAGMQDDVFQAPLAEAAALAPARARTGCLCAMVSPCAAVPAQERRRLRQERQQTETVKS